MSENKFELKDQTPGALLEIARARHKTAKEDHIVVDFSDIKAEFGRRKEESRSLFLGLARLTKELLERLDTLPPSIKIIKTGGTMTRNELKTKVQAILGAEIGRGPLPHAVIRDIDDIPFSNLRKKVLHIIELRMRMIA